jgi:DNA-binding transcriptional ArsR family regulator
LHRRAVSYLFNQMVKCESEELDRTFAALADPTRRRMLEQLSRGELRVTDLAKPHEMSLPAVSKHLGVLEKAGLIDRERKGRVHTLRLRAEPMKEVQAWIESYRRYWEESFDRLDDYLNQLKNSDEKQPE